MAQNQTPRRPHGPHGLEACLAICVGPQWPGLANTCLGLLPACVGTVPCTWLHTASLFWHVNTFWRPLGHSLVTTRILAFFCHLWAAGMPTQLLGGPQGWVALKIGCISHAPNQNGHPKPNGARHGMGAKTPFPFKKGQRVWGFLAMGHRLRLTTSGQTLYWLCFKNPTG